jgi:hypothetical protein
MNNNSFKRGKIYTIRSHKTPLIYVGSTTQKHLSNRLSGHKTQYKRYKKDKAGFCASFDILEIDENCYIELYEEYPCDSKEQLDKREGQVIRELDCCNKRIAGRTPREWYEDNKQKKLDYRKQYYATHKDKCKEQSREYQITHKDELKDYMKKYRTKNKDKIKANKSQKHTCECGGRYIHNHKARHMKTKKHQEYMDFMYN